MSLLVGVRIDTGQLGNVGILKNEIGKSNMLEVNSRLHIIVLF